MDEVSEFVFEAGEAGGAAERLVVAEEGDDGVRIEPRKPGVGGVHFAVADIAGAPAVFGGGKWRVVFFGTGEGPRGGACGVGAKAGGVALVAEVAYEEVVLRVAALEFGFEMAEVHHAGAEPVAEEDDAGVWVEL